MKVEKLKRRLEKKLLKNDGVEAVGYDGEHFIVYVKDEAIAEQITMQKYSGIPIKVIVSGEFRALGENFFRP